MTDGDAKRELRALFEEVAPIDWTSPAWRGLVAAIAASERWANRALTPAAAADAFVTALEANSGPAADTFMATFGAPPPDELDARIDRALDRAVRLARTLRAQDRTAPGQRLLQAMRHEGGWLRGAPLEASSTVTIAFITSEGAFVGDIDPSVDLDDPAALAPLRAALRVPERSAWLRPIDRRASRPTPAAAAVCLQPVPQSWARSFHRAAWTRGGGPWMGVADTAAHSVVSTCHAAVDGYAHARVSASVLRPSPPRRPRPAADPFGGVPGVVPPEVGFAARALTGSLPRFATAVHAFSSVLDRRLGGSSTRTPPIHIPIAPGVPADHARWRRRPLYGLFALRKTDGQIESLSSLRARLPAYLAREASGRGALTRVLRATLELPLPRWALRPLIARQPWTDRWLEPARVLTGAGYVSWMRFPAGERPRLPTFPSAIPSFTGDGRGGAGLSIASYDGGLAVGLTTSGELAQEATSLLDAWVEELDLAAIRAGVR